MEVYGKQLLKVRSHTSSCSRGSRAFDIPDSPRCQSRLKNQDKEDELVIYASVNLTVCGGTAGALISVAAGEMGSFTDSRMAMASVVELAHSSSSDRMPIHFPSREDQMAAKPPMLNTMVYNPFTDNPHAATGNYSLVVEGTINPNRPVTSMLPPLERQALMRTAGERAMKREKREVVRKLGNKPGTHTSLQAFLSLFLSR